MFEGRNEDAVHRLVWKSIASGAELLLSDPDDWLETAYAVKDWPHALDQLEGELLLGATVRPVVRMTAARFWITNCSVIGEADAQVRFARLLLPPYGRTPHILWRPQPRGDLRIWTRNHVWFGNEDYAHFYAWPGCLYDPSELIAIERIEVPVGAIISHVGEWYSHPCCDMFIIDPAQLPRIDTLPARQIEWQSGFGSWLRMTAGYSKAVKMLHAHELKSIKPKRGRKTPVRP